MSKILSRFEALHPTSAALARRARQVFPDGVTHDLRRLAPFSLYVSRASGSRKWDVDGNELVDYVMGHGALLLGHAHPDVTAAVAEQLVRGSHYGASHELELRWGELVQRLVPSAQLVRFTSSGTEATMMAVRLARAFTGRPLLVRFAAHFHGWNDLMSGQPAPGEGLTPVAPGIPPGALADVAVLPQNDARRFRDFVRSRGDDIAAVIVEPTGASSGTIPMDPAFLTVLRDETASCGAVLIFDEVITGFRVAPGGAQERFGVTPDLTTLAKILAGGLPGGAVCGREDIVGLIRFRDNAEWNARQRIAHPGTFNANPLSAAAGSTCLSLIADGRAQDEAARTCRALVTGMNRLLHEAGVVGCVYGDRSMFHIALGVEPRLIDDFAWDWRGEPAATMPPADARATAALRRALINEGVDLMGSGGMVSAVHTSDDVARTLEAFERALAALKEDGYV
ncbi:MAG TPA: aspartate aminotransferase family protein [Dehalococcoidia bacterium]|nr:aspartate aminotransferase family protein [Dehalococcoidia bacterium]